jgi:hypothetical protein
MTMSDQSKTQAGQGAAASDEDNEHSGGERFNRRLLVIAGVFAVVVGVIAGEGIRSAGVKTTSAGHASADRQYGGRGARQG